MKQNIAEHHVGGFKNAVGLPNGLDFAAIFPKTNCQAREKGGPKRSRLDDLWPDDRHTENVSLELKQQVVG